MEAEVSLRMPYPSSSRHHQRRNRILGADAASPAGTAAPQADDVVASAALPLPSRASGRSTVRVTPLLAQSSGQSDANFRPASFSVPGWIGTEAPAALEPLVAGSSRGDGRGGTACPAPANGITILIVENEESNRTLMEKILGFAGYKCVAACNGQEAVDLFDRRRPALILTDISMPVMDGYEATAAIRERAEGATVPIVAVTAHAMAGDRERAIQQGCTEYLAKPYRTRELLDVVERLLSNRSV
jgi:CheY-like chemotaxis protein